MRCFTDAELRAGLVAVVLAGDEADLLEVFLLAAEQATKATHDRDRDREVSDGESGVPKNG